MKGFGDLYKSENKLKKKSKLTREKIINKAIQFHFQGIFKKQKKIMNIA